MSARYAELHCLSNFSFLRGASHPHELVEAAQRQGYDALALTDECSLAGIVRAHVRARELGLKLIIGTELQLEEGIRLVLLAPTAAAYTQLCRLVTRARRQARKGQYRVTQADLLDKACSECLMVLIDPGEPHDSIRQSQVQALVDAVPLGAWVAVECHRDGRDAMMRSRQQSWAQALNLPLVACGDVHMHCRARRAIQDTLTAIRHGCTLEDAGHRLFPNGERHLRPRADLATLYPATWREESLRIAARCHFSLDMLRYRYPSEDLPTGLTANQYLAQRTHAGLHSRYPDGVPKAVRALVNKELRLIEELGYAQYFLTVDAIMQWARAQGILCQGRGSAANSAVCFALGITVVDPARGTLLFERFVSAERCEPPDIDIDFEHTRREEVFQHIYQRYGRHRAALAATVIRYRRKSALRDVGKALGLPMDTIETISGALAWWDDPAEFPEQLRTRGLDPDTPILRRLLLLVNAIRGFPRHLSQHVGGFVISDAPLDGLVPIENAAMADRTVIQWDKDDLDDVGLFKVDCLALGMLTAIHRAQDMIAHHYGQDWSIPAILATEAEQGATARQVFDMLCAAQSEGVFQVESRAQMAMLPRMRPRTLYDLTIETAIVRPGPIQGGMVHPYLNRRMGREPIDCPPGLESVLLRTHGIPIFQEQVMEICVKGAGFAPGEADQVRRSMAAWGRDGHGKLERFEQRLKEGLQTRGYSAAFAERIFAQLKGFAEYGFPESHAASFAVLVYVSAWLKRFYPAAFLASLLNSQPMGFYSPSQLVQAFRRQHGVITKPPDVLHSDWDCTLELPPDRGCASRPQRTTVRLGLRMIKGLGREAGECLVARRTWRPWPQTVSQWFDDCVLDERARQALARADALRSVAGDRHQTHWQAEGFWALAKAEGPANTVDWRVEEEAVTLDRPAEGEDIVADYASLGLTLRRHPLALLRPRLRQLRSMTTAQWHTSPDQHQGRVAGLITNRQRPGTAQGIVFLTLEDEAGTANVVVRPGVLEQYRQTVLQGTLVVIEGRHERRDGVSHLLAEALEDHASLLGQLQVRSRNFH